jgi:uncharacterized membrane protein YcaP (DUF421 family)
MGNMAVTFIRTSIVYITLIIIMRLMGKRQIGEMQPYEFIVTLIIADLACIPMTDVSIPIVYGIVGILSLFLLHQLISLLEQSGPLARRIISGKPSLVVNKDGVDMLELKRNNMGIDDLIESARSAGAFCLDGIDYAIFESNGKISLVKNEQACSNSSLPVVIVNDGRIDKKNLELLKIDSNRVIDFIKINGGALKSTEVLTVDGQGKTYFKQKNKRFKVLEFNLPEGVNW